MADARSSYLPVMISRIMLSLKKAADSRQKGWSLGEPTADTTNFQGMTFFRPARDMNTKRDDVPLDTYSQP